MTEPLRLLPGLRLVRRDAEHVQLGIDPAALCGAPRPAGGTPPRQRPRGGQPARSGRVRRSAAPWPPIIDAGLLVPDDAPSARQRVTAGAAARGRRAGRRRGVTALLEEAGVAARVRAAPPDAVLLVCDGEVARGRARPAGPRRGAAPAGPRPRSRDRGRPVRGAWTHRLPALRRLPPRRARPASRSGGRAGGHAANRWWPLRSTPTLRAVALSLAVRDLVTFVEGDRAGDVVGHDHRRPLARPRAHALAAAPGVRLRLGRAGDRGE